MRAVITAVVLSALLVGCGGGRDKPEPNIVTSTRNLPPMAWDHRPEAPDWTRAGLRAVASHGQNLVSTVPQDIRKYCPGYVRASEQERAAFWVGLLSALAKYESTWRPEAVGGRSQWYGLVQIDPRTAQGYGCRAQSGRALTDGSLNISCAVRIADYQVGRDEFVVGNGNGWRGMARDWAPFRVAEKREWIADWTSAQPYCR